MSTPAAEAANENGNEDQNSEKTWQKSDKEFLLVVVTFIAAVAFQAGINPPGGVWQDASDPSAGKSIMATKQPSHFIIFIVSTTMCMVVSMVQFSVLFTDLPYYRVSVSRYCMYASLSFAIGSMFSAYWMAVTALTPTNLLHEVTNTLRVQIIIAVGLLLILVYIQKRRPNALDC